MDPATTENEDSFVERAMRRINRLMVVFAVGGTLALLALRGWAWGAGFACGALASWLNFRWLEQMVGALGSSRPRFRIVLIVVLRYGLLGGGSYAILRYSFISLPAVLAGLFVAVAAVLAEILLQLFYARV